MPLFDLKKQLIFYGAYHNDPVNVAIHMTCVPVLLATGFLFGTNTPSLPTPAFLARRNLPLNLGTLAAALYATLYIALDPAAGGALAPLVIASASFMNKLRSTYGATANKVGVAVHVGAWILQFIGHGKYEGRAPALLDNLVQALFLAPFFVWYEVLFKLGFRPQLKKEVEEGINAEIARVKAEKAAKKGE